MRSLRTKLVMIMVILILALMCVIGAFLINGVGNFYISQFYEQMEKTFSPDFIGQLQTIPAQEQSAPVRMKELLMAQAGLGIDIATRNVYILDETGNVLASSNQETNVSMTANLLTAMNGEVGQEGSITSSYMDLAVPIVSTNGTYIVYILDSRATVDALTGELFSIILERAWPRPCDLRGPLLPSCPDSDYAHPRADPRHAAGCGGRFFSAH